MNIFYLDKDIKNCAQYHCDRHVVKMILETAQILCTVLWANNMLAPYRPTHKNHPSVLWAGRSLSNWQWLKNLATELNKEFQYRFNHTKNHKSYDVILTLTPPPIPDLGFSDIIQVMPEEFKQTDPVLAYREYFIIRKSHLAKWTKRPTPDWFRNSFLLTKNKTPDISIGNSE
jgi:hypothetical protein